MSTIGFVILSHSNPDQLLHLVRRLGSMFQDAKISCAHDFGQAPIEQEAYPACVSFVRPHVATSWGDISVVRAAMHALRDLYDKADPEWFVLLSGSDYPVLPSDIILRDLKTGGYDAYLDFREVSYASIHPGGRPPSAAKYGFDRPEWTQLAYERYIMKVIDYPVITRALKLAWRKRSVWRPWLLWPFHPFSSTLRCYGGDHWLTANRRVARILLDEFENGARLIKHFSSRKSPDEAFYQTVICNRPDLRVCKDNKRYADWSLVEAHPKVLGIGDLPAIAASGAHFARKFPPGSPALALLDRVIDQK
jgi:hypothetical protein